MPVKSVPEKTVKVTGDMSLKDLSSRKKGFAKVCSFQDLGKADLNQHSF